LYKNNHFEHTNITTIKEVLLTMFDKAIKGVNCDVSECKYHDGVRSCTASCISVEGNATMNGPKTCCGTYEKK
jgi:hypothetical protein